MDQLVIRAAGEYNNYGRPGRRYAAMIKAGIVAAD